MLRSVLAEILVCTIASAALAVETESPTGALPDGRLELDLSRGWKFARGDDVRWAIPSYDDSAWEAIEVGRTWEAAGHRDYDGFAWYRVRFRVPAAWETDPRLARQRKLVFRLGAIDDVDETWLNGKRIGSTGSFPPAPVTRWEEERRYLVDPGHIRWGRENVLAIRVFDLVRGGGLYRGPYTLGVCSWTDLTSLRIRGSVEDGIFPAGSPMAFAAAVECASRTNVRGRVHWTVETDAGVLVAEDSSARTLEPGSASFVFRCPPPAPGFYRVRCRFDGGDGELSHSMLFGFAPEQIVVPPTARSDLRSFWTRSMEELRAVAPEFRVTERDSKDTTTRKLYEVEMRSLGGVRVRGWYETPLAPGRYPAVLRVPGYGEEMRPVRRFDDMVVFSFNVRAHGNSQEDVSGEPVDYWIRGLDDKNDYFYRGAFLDCVRAVDYLVSRSEVDPERIAIIGASQGGGLSFATAALDSRIALCAPDIPFLCDWVNYFELTEWPEMNDWIAARSERTWATTLATLSYFDAMNLAPWIDCPVFMGVGLQDDVCPAATVFAAYNRVRAEKSFRVYPHERHRVGDEHRDLVYAWIRKRFGVESRASATDSE